MGNKVNLLNEVYNRLNTAIGSGNDLYGIKRIQFGSREEARKDNDLPIINVKHLGGNEPAHYQNNGFIDEMRIEITLICSKKPGENALFDTGTQTGATYWLEKMLNVLDKNTSGVVDNTFSDTAENIKSYDYDIEESNDVVEIAVLMTVQTKHFAAGGR